jgi:hypothetical protein
LAVSVSGAENGKLKLSLTALAENGNLMVTIEDHAENRKPLRIKQKTNGLFQVKKRTDRSC